MNILESVKSRFLRYVQVDTQSANESGVFPTTLKQLDLAAMLAEECKSIGLTDVCQDEYGYVYASLPSNIQTEAPTIGFVAHMDTSPDCSGVNVKPRVIHDYDGGDIALGAVTLSPAEFPSLNQYKGLDIITASGGTLLGADDKAGLAEILTAMEYLIENPDIRHGKIRVGFTPDEEVGHGVDRFDLEIFGAAYAYTIDGGEIGELEAENFNAARAIINITGKSIHTGSAKGIMVNAALIAVELASRMPENEIPAQTEGYEGFFHLLDIQGQVEHARVVFLIRDFDVDSFNARKAFIKENVTGLNEKYEGALSLNLYDEYLNMAGPLAEHGPVVDRAHKAMEDAGIIPIRKPIRGGTDGSRLCYMGLPCPNIFTGGHNAHGPYEYIPLRSMEKAVEVIVNICKSSVQGFVQ
ncbi:MAG: peptidase T [Clostridiales bacterium]|nr:peptidase T [Clostridiales bacterium]